MKAAKEIYMYVLGGIIVLAIIAAVVLLIMYPVPDQNKEVVFTLAGALVTLAVTVVTYFYGSSKSSADKTELISKGKENETNL